MRNGYPDHNWNGEDAAIAREYYEKTGNNIHAPDADPEWKKRYEEAYERARKSRQETIEKARNAFFQREWELKFKGRKCFRVSFSDGDGDVFAAMEHGNAFRNVPHTRISHH